MCSDYSFAFPVFFFFFFLARFLSRRPSLGGLAAVRVLSRFARKSRDGQFVGVEHLVRTWYVRRGLLCEGSVVGMGWALLTINIATVLVVNMPYDTRITLVQECIIIRSTGKSAEGGEVDALVL